MYYLQSRYYAPEVGRFINADNAAYLGYNNKLTSYNLYAYCGDNPVCNHDSEGDYWQELWEEFIQVVQQSSGIFVLAGEITQLDSPLLGVMDIAGATIAVTTLFACLGVAAYSALSVDSLAIPISGTQEKEIEIAETESRALYIYRHRGTNPGNLVPTSFDVKLNSGLSFSTIPMPNSWKTSVSAINSTGVLYAVIDGPTHVSVYPIGGTVADWRKMGADSIWTKTLIMISGKVK